jgi:hypothetical protein
MLKLSDKNVSKKMYEDYLKYLLEKYFNINLSNNIIDNNSFLNFSCFYPLPNLLDINYYKDDDEVIEENNIYKFTGEFSNIRILFGNRLLPNPNTDPIPFTFPIKTNINTIELINTNCFYYEVTICERIRDYYDNETISIGYGSITTPIRCNPGWVTDTVGYHLNDGSIQCNQIIIKNSGPICNIGDTVGAIIVYVSINNYQIFFTFNGSIIINKNFNNNIFIKSQIVPIIGYNHSCKIKVNFGNEVFKFNIKNFYNTNFIISQNNKFINDHNFINNIKTETIVKNKITNKNNTKKKHFFTLDQNAIFTPVFSFSNSNIETNALQNILLNIVQNNNLD